MEVWFADQKLADTCASNKAMVRTYGALRAKRIAVRLQQLRVIETLAEIRELTTRAHDLTGDLRGSIALDLDGPYRLLLRPLDEDGDPMEPPVDWHTVTAVVIDGIEDYH